MKNIHDVLIIGGGLSGSLLGSMIVKRGLDVLIVEKSKLLGGRCSSKPVDGGLADYGCQLFKPKSRTARLFLEDLHKKQIVQYSRIQNQHSSYVGNYGISKIPQYFSLGVPSLTNTKIDCLRYHEGLWNVYSENKHFTSKTVIMTMPTKQVKHLISKSTLDYDLTTPKPKYRALYTCTFSSISDIEFMESTDHRDFSWIINNTKKGIHNFKLIYTVNSSERLTKKLQILDKTDQISLIDKALSNYGFKQINDLKIHFWKYAFTKGKSPLEYSWNPEYGIGACGDGYGHGNIDGAITSAYQIKDPIIHFLDQ